MDDKNLKILGDYLTKKKANQPVTIKDEPLVPIDPDEVVPDRLFYSAFQPDEAETFFDIYEAFKALYQDSPQMAVGTLDSNLNNQVREMPKEICPVDIILYASRLIAEELDSDPDVFNCVRDHVVRNLKNADTETARYILGGWTWNMQISLFVEAVGRANRPKLIETAMKYYPRIVSLCKNDQFKRPLKAYLNMLLEAQNEDSLSEFVTVVSEPAFAKDDRLTTYFLDDCLKGNPFLRNASFRNNLIEELLACDLPSKFRRQLELQGGPGPGPRELTVLDIENLAFGSYSAEDLGKCEGVKDPELRIIVCKKIRENIDRITPGVQLGRAYMLLGTKGHGCARDMVRFLEGEKKRSPEYAVPIAIALLDLGAIDENGLLDTLFSENCYYQNFWGMNLSKYFVFKRHTINLYAYKLLPYVSKCLRLGNLDEEHMGYYLDILNNVTDAIRGNYNGSELLSIPKVPDSILAIVSSVPTKQTTNRTLCNTILDLLDSYIYISKVRVYLNKLKKELGPNMLEIEERINGMLRRGDQIALPMKS